MLNEEQILKDAVKYLKEGFASDGVKVFPKNQDKPSAFPCITLTVSSQVNRTGITQELLANVQIHATVFSPNIYAPTGSFNGIHTIFDKLNTLMAAKHYGRSNQTEPHFNNNWLVWNKDGYFTKKSNSF